MNRICNERPPFSGESTAPADSTDFPINFLILFHDLPIDEISLLVGVRTAHVVPDRAVIGRLLADNVTDVISLASADNERLYVSPSIERVTGFAPGELVLAKLGITSEHVVAGNIDPEESRQEVLTEIATNVGQTFLGMTINCARCHNHKFDPILQADFYSLQAIFAGAK